MITERIDTYRLLIRDVIFDPELTLLDSAQTFQWEKTDEGYRGIVAGHSLLLIKADDGFILDGCRTEDEAFWIHYFDLNRDYTFLTECARACPLALRAVLMLPGLVVLNQPPWETLITFIISANNNTQRIRRLVRCMIDDFGQSKGFPSPSVLSEMECNVLLKRGFGYRAPYLINTAKIIADGFDLESLREMDYEDAHKALITLPGVGDKVADCVQLFGLRHSKAFPVDVWMKRVMKRIAPQATTNREIRQAAWDLFGDSAGLVQQSLFHCARTGMIDFEAD